MLDKKTHWKYILEDVCHREYIWRYSAPALLSVFAAWLIFSAQGCHESKLKLDRQRVVVGTLNAELGIDILIAEDLNKRVSLLVTEVGKHGQKYFWPEIVDEMQKLACGQMAECFGELKNDNRTDNYVCLLHFRSSLGLLRDHTGGDREGWIKAANAVALASQNYINSAKLLQSNIQKLE
jgi:hypothetical protein